MEYLKVIVPEKIGQDIDVLVNGEKNGKVGDTLILTKGITFVSVDLFGAKQVQVNLCNTTYTHPKIIEIEI